MNTGSNRYSRTVLLALIVSLPSMVFAQPSAGFTSSIVSGCSPIIVHFTDQSTGTPTSWRWDLGNGVISFLQNPSTTYFNPGTYNVKLVVSNTAGSDSIIKHQYITVYPNPVSNFNASDSSGCIPLMVQFTDRSTTSSGTIVNWNWDFGDGTISTAINPSHSYINPGNYTVSLQVTNSFGCTKTFSKPQYIHVNSRVAAGFTNVDPPACQVPAAVSFTNTSTGNGTLSYNWQFGDGSTSTVTDPVHSYLTAGTYTATLIAENAEGCRDTIMKNIHVGTVLSQFNSPDSVCEQQSFTITNTTTPAPISVSWDFGDGTTSTAAHPVKTYNATGTFTIKLVNHYNGCSDSTFKTIYVKPVPIADFSANQTQSCKVPFTVNFTNHTTNGNSYSWNFGDGNTSTATNPVHTYTVPGNYTVTLQAINVNGCRNTIIKHQYIRITEPVATLHNLPRNGCIPLQVSPTATVVANEPVVSYLWNFGDGTTSTNSNPVHTYNAAGTYSVTLIIETSSGCRDTVTMIDAVRAGEKPQAAFSVNPTDVCAYQSIQFTDNSIGNVDQWYWQFGDGGISSLQNPLHEYEDTGYFSVTLIVISNTCPDTIRLDSIVHIRPPVAKFTYIRSCADKYRIDFIDQSIGATEWSWDFGDGAHSTQPSPSHIYASPGTYEVILTVTNGTCFYRKSVPIRIIDEQAAFNASDTIICKGTSILFNSIGINPANISAWQWDFGDGTTTMTPLSVTHIYTDPGVYNVSLIIKDLFDCPDTSNMQVTVFGPSAGFIITNPNVCFRSAPVLFADVSTTDGTNPLVKWIWNYGDATIDSTSPPPYSHLYTTPGIYDISLTVVDSYGCRDSALRPASVIISQPVAGFYSPDTITCTNKPVHFINTSSGYNLQYNWNFGDGTNAATQNPAHSYLNTGTYQVSLLVTDQYGCKDSITREAYISISLPVAGFVVSDSFSTCPPLQASFTNTSSGFISLLWDFGDGNSSTLNAPSHLYTLPGIYIAQLIATGPGGCKDTMNKRIEVQGPRGNFNYAPLKGCEPFTVTFTATTLSRLSFVWDFSDGSTVATADSVITHTYTSAGTYLPKMILVDQAGCNVPIVGNDTIEVVGVRAGFQMDRHDLCDSGYVSFNDQTVSNDLITNWQWNFGDGHFSNMRDPSHYYTSPGIYHVQLIVSTQTGCVDSLQAIVNIFPSPGVTILGDSVACAPGQLDFSSIVTGASPGSLIWQWNLGNGNTFQQHDPPLQYYPVAGSYTITAVVTDEHGCRDSISKPISIHPVPITNAGADSLLCRGNSITLHASGATSYQWEPATGLSCFNCADPVASPFVSTQYIVTGSNAFGCSSRDTIMIPVQQPFILQVGPGDTLCLGESTRLFATGADQYTWSPATGLNNPIAASPTAHPFVSTLYTLIATDNVHCFADTATIYIHVYPIPTVNAGPDQTIAIGSAVQLHATGSPDISWWKWSPPYQLSCVDCPDPFASPKQTTQYLLEVMNDGGCKNRDIVVIYVTCPQGTLFIPNTFSPNGDGMNDRFYPRGKEIATIRSFVIYDRWGEIVFQKNNFAANDATAGWDGRYKGKLLSPDVYVYTCEIQCLNNEILRYKGDVTLLQ